MAFDDVQGLVRFGHGHLSRSVFHLLWIVDVEAARAWLQQAPVTSAAAGGERPAQVLQLAFSAAGLCALGIDREIVSDFSAEFNAGMAGDSNRSRRLGDIGANDPGRWRWGGAGASAPHVLLLLYADDSRIEDWQSELFDAAFEQAFERRIALPGELGAGREHFGFVDGISQPEIDWQGDRSVDSHRRSTYSNRLAPGEILLGYPNEYGLYTRRPLLDPARCPAAAVLPEATEQPQLKDLGRNGSYLVLRQLSQDVPAFWQFLDRVAQGDETRREQLAQAMVGRKRDGEPLLEARGLNAFDYDDDPAGQRCPLGAHVRRANPRTGDFPPHSSGILKRLLRTLGFGSQSGRDDLVAATRFHRLLRRGRIYGGALGVAEALATEAGGVASEEERGLLFVCLGASISRQFEFVQNAWLDSAKFAGLRDESDPLLGHRQPMPGGLATDHFSIPRAGRPADRVEGLPQFVQVRGGEYFFLPGLRALRFIAGGGQ
ncbi:peroxidase [Parahaliea aestuarii]|uniref:Peroxidase n=1 Tax=Parahaliea aestuarii TaxID=1852021 RepID=A0A5C8ZT72_9GAMM|nr:peroxidase [Parahaliea aestuarii]